MRKVKKIIALLLSLNLIPFVVVMDAFCHGKSLSNAYWDGWITNVIIVIFAGFVLFILYLFDPE